MTRLLSISICLICTLATFADAQVEGLINPCATKSYFYKKSGQWHLYVYESGKTKEIGEGKTGPHTVYEFGPHAPRTVKDPLPRLLGLSPRRAVSLVLYRD